MKQSFFHLITIIAVVVTIMLNSSSAMAYDFTVDGLNYTVTDSQELECEIAGPKGYEGTLVIPDSVIYMGKTLKVVGVGENAFFCKENTSDAKKLKAIYMPNSIRYIKLRGFACNEFLKTVVLSTNLEIIDERSFTGCRHLEDIDIPDKVKTIGSWAFHNDWNLSIKKLPFCLERVGKDAFTQVSLGPEIELPSLKVAEDYAFSGLKNRLTKVTLHEGLDSIGEGAFQLNDITELELPKSVKYVGKLAFESSKKLTNLTIKGTPVIWDKAFSNCTSLEKIYCKDESTYPKLIAQDCFDSAVYKLTDLYVPATLFNEFRQAYVWREFQNLKIDDSFVYELKDNNAQRVSSIYSINGDLLYNEVSDYEIPALLPKGVFVIVPVGGVPYKIIN